MNKANIKQQEYRQRIKFNGGVYVGAYLLGEASKLLLVAKEQQKKSYSVLLSQAVISAFGKAGEVSAPIPVLPSTLEEQRWEEFK